MRINIRKIDRSNLISWTLVVTKLMDPWIDCHCINSRTSKKKLHCEIKLSNLMKHHLQKNFTFWYPETNLRSENTQWAPINYLSLQSLEDSPLIQWDCGCCSILSSLSCPIHTSVFIVAQKSKCSVFSSIALRHRKFLRFSVYGIGKKSHVINGHF